MDEQPVPATHHDDGQRDEELSGLEDEVVEDLTVDDGEDVKGGTTWNCMR